MDFLNINTIDELIKIAEQEILLSGIAIDSEEGAMVVPVKCPAKGRKEDYGKDSEGKPTCVYNGTVCPYFDNTMFTLKDFTKKIICRMA
jgi:hypothetical protein